MKSDCYFEECKDCTWREHNDDLMCCLTNRLGLAWHKLLIEIPIISKFIDKHRYCHYYEREQGVLRGNRVKILLCDDYAPMFKEYFNKFDEENTMKISEMIKNLQDFMAENGDLECWYAVDDEGNAYHRVYFKPSMYFANEDDEIYQSDDLEYLDLNEENVRPICIVN